MYLELVIERYELSRLVVTSRESHALARQTIVAYRLVPIHSNYAFKGHFISRRSLFCV